jgi:hypothetical protein
LSGPEKHYQREDAEQGGDVTSYCSTSGSFSERPPEQADFTDCLTLDQATGSGTHQLATPDARQDSCPDQAYQRSDYPSSKIIHRHRAPSLSHERYVIADRPVSSSRPLENTSESLPEHEIRNLVAEDPSGIATCKSTCRTPNYLRDTR